MKHSKRILAAFFASCFVCGLPVLLPNGPGAVAQAADEPAQNPDLKIGRAYLDAKRYIEAEAIFREAATGPTPDYYDDLEAYKGLSEALGGQGKVTQRKGVDRLATAVRYVLAGNALMVMGEPNKVAEAAEMFREAVKYDPKNVEAWLHLGDVLYLQDKRYAQNTTAECAEVEKKLKELRGVHEGDELRKVLDGPATPPVAGAAPEAASPAAAPAIAAPAGGDKDAEIAELKRRLAELNAPKTPAAIPGTAAAAPGPGDVPLRPLDQSEIVVKDAAGAPVVADKNGKGIDGIKLSQHDRLIGSPSIAVAPDGVIHVVFVENHRTTSAPAVYHRSSADGGKTWTEAKNLTEDMGALPVGRCQVLADARNRVYVVYRVALNQYAGAKLDPVGDLTNLWFRELEGGKWSKAKPISEPVTGLTQNDAARSFFSALDAAGRVQVLWNVQPDKWHPNLKKFGGHTPGIGNGLVFQSTLDGATAGKPREVFLPVITSPVKAGGNPSCDGLDTLNGYVDAAGAAHFIAKVTMPPYGLPAHPPRYALIENGKEGQGIELPNASYHEWKDIPTLLVDAKGKRHMIAYFPTGEHPNIRDYLLGSEDEPTVIRAAAGLNGLIDGFQAYQGPGGRMVAIMQMNDTGERFAGDNFVSISTGEGKWSVPVNVTNNAGRKKFHNTQTSAQSNVGAITSCLPGPGAAAFDQDGHLLLVIVKEEYAIVIATAFGVNTAGGDVKIPTLRFLKF